MATVASYLLELGGTGFVLFLVAQTFSGNLRYLQARLVMTNMLRTNPNNAEAMCKTAPDTFFAAIGAVIKTLAMAKSRDPALLAKISQPTYDGAVTAVGMAWTKKYGKAKLAVVAAVGGLLLAINGGKAGFLLVFLAIIAVAGGVWILLNKIELDRSLLLARAEVLPEVDRAFIDGRYQFPPG